MRATTTLLRRRLLLPGRTRAMITTLLRRRLHLPGRIWAITTTRWLQRRHLKRAITTTWLLRRRTPAVPPVLLQRWWLDSSWPWWLLFQFNVLFYGIIVCMCFLIGWFLPPFWVLWFSSTVVFVIHRFGGVYVNKVCMTVWVLLHAWILILSGNY